MSSIKRGKFGETGWEVSSLSLGAFRNRDLSRQEAVALLHRAFESGINLVDATQGEGEAILDEALRRWREPIRVATRVDAGDAARVVKNIETCLRRLDREQLDLVLMEGAGAEDLDGAVMEALIAARQRGKVEHIGAAVPVADGLAAARHPDIAVLQVAFNLLDQRAERGGVFTEAAATGTALLCRHPLLGGVLTDERRELPEQLSRLTVAAGRAERWASKHGDDLATGALRFCLAQDEISSVVVGVDSEAELDRALAAASAPALPRHQLSDAAPLTVVDEVDEVDEDLIDPRKWS